MTRVKHYQLYRSFFERGTFVKGISTSIQRGYKVAKQQASIDAEKFALRICERRLGISVRIEAHRFGYTVRFVRRIDAVPCVATFNFRFYDI